MVLEDVRQVVAVRPQLEQLADGQPRSVAERLAVHHQRILLDPLDGHRSGALVQQLEDRVPLVVAGDAAVPAVGLDRGVERLGRRGELARRQDAPAATPAGPRTGRSGRSSGSCGGDRRARSTRRTRGRGPDRPSPDRARRARPAARRRGAGAAGPPRRNGSGSSDRHRSPPAGLCPRVVPDRPGCGRRRPALPAVAVARRQAEARMAHEAESSRASRAGRHVAAGRPGAPATMAT